MIKLITINSRSELDKISHNAVYLLTNDKLTCDEFAQITKQTSYSLLLYWRLLDLKRILTENRKLDRYSFFIPCGND